MKVKSDEQPALPEPQRAELWNDVEAVLMYIIENGYTSREEIARGCSSSATGNYMSERSVSRHPRVLTEAGMLRKVGNGYEPSELSRKLSRQDTV
ncbi:MAG: hypothetical protein JRN58_05385 [Nitrososphaerota archaeon]|nr:hypothetical protein [Nitrososphaerota archaeon]MDG6978497.1 hypothetical protein [Nitrososphaerota archaeon]